MDGLNKWMLGLNDFPARWFCGNWSKPHGWVHIISDVLVWLAYLAIPLILLYFIRKRENLIFPRVFYLFVAFIASCGTVHLLEAIIYWVPIYRISAITKSITAIVSWATVFALIPIIPFALELKTPKELLDEVERRKASEESLRLRSEELLDIKNNLEAKVKERSEMVEQERQQLALKVEEKTKELNKRVQQLEDTNRSMVNRELRMVELKNEVKELKARLGAKETQA